MQLQLEPQLQLLGPVHVQGPMLDEEDVVNFMSRLVFVLWCGECVERGVRYSYAIDRAA